MGYRTVMRFTRPLRLILEVEDPALGRRHADIALVGVGRAGLRHHIEADDGPGRPVRAIPIGRIRSARRADGFAVDLRRLILDPAYHALMVANGRPPLRPPVTSLARLRERLVFGGLGGLVLFLVVIFLPPVLPFEDAETAEAVALVVAMVVVFGGFGLWEYGPELRVLQELRLLLGLWRA